jgi:hypothetical protein
MQVTPPSPLQAYISHPHVPEANFALGRWYETQGHDSPALSFYIRTAEFAEEVGFDGAPELITLAYESLLRAHFCIDRQRTRELTAKSLLQRAIALAPYRPEAYYLLAKFELRKANWPEVYMFCNIGYNLPTPDDTLSGPIEGYVGPESFLFAMMLSSHHWGRGTESRQILQELVTHHKDILSSTESPTAQRLLRSWGVGPAAVADVPYVGATDMGRLKWGFEGLEGVERNYSQAYQDMFVLTVLDGKRNGTYLEIGSEEPQYKSNTYLLEGEFSWRGISVEIDEPEVARFRAERSNPVICADATKLDYASLLEKANFPAHIDYLQIDTEPSSTSFEVLLTIPFERYKFAVITFEHDHAVDFSRTYRDKSRRYLRSLGYELVVPDAGPTDWYSFEDWWVEPSLVDTDRLKEMGMVIAERSGDGANSVLSYFLKTE